MWLALKNGPSSVEADVLSASLLQQESGLWFLQVTNGDHDQQKRELLDQMGVAQEQIPHLHDPEIFHKCQRIINIKR